MKTQIDQKLSPIWKQAIGLPVLAVLTIMLLAANKSVAQEISKDSVYTFAEKMPEFPGGSDAMMKFLSKEVKYPAACREKKIEGRVVLQFIVDEEGNITNIESKKDDVDPLLIKEAIRVVSKMPKWTPATQNNKPVKVKFVLPVVFKLT